MKYHFEWCKGLTKSFSSVLWYLIYNTYRRLRRLVIKKIISHFSKPLTRTWWPRTQFVSSGILFFKTTVPPLGRLVFVMFVQQVEKKIKQQIYSTINYHGFHLCVFALVFSPSFWETFCSRLRIYVARVSFPGKVG